MIRTVARDPAVSSDAPEKFVQEVITACLKEKGYAVRMKRSDNPATEYLGWEILASYGIDLEKGHERLPYVIIAAAIAKKRPKKIGRLSLGQGIAASYEDGNSGNQAITKVRQLLACHDTAEVCLILRKIFSKIHSRCRKTLNYTRILEQLLQFNRDAQSVKAQWAQEFYRYHASSRGNEK